MSFKNIGKFLSAGNDINELKKVAHEINDVNAVVAALKETKLNNNFKIATLLQLDEVNTREKAMELLDIADGFEQVGQKAGESTGKLSGFGSSLKGMFSADPVGSVLAIGGAVVGIVSSIIQAIEAHKQALIDQATEATSAWEDSQTSLENYQSRYEELKNKLASGDLSESETLAIKQEIADLQSEIVNKYGEQASGIDLVNGKLDEQKAKLAEISHNEALSILNNNQAAYDDAEKEMLKHRSYKIGTTYDKTTEYGKALEALILKYKDNGVDISYFDNPQSYAREIYMGGTAEEIDENLNLFMNDLRTLQSIYGNTVASSNELITEASKAKAENKENVLDKYQENYRAKVEQDFWADEDYEANYSVLQNYAKAVDNYNDALASGDTTLITKSKNEYAEALKVKDDFLSTEGNQKYSEMFEDITQQLDTASIYANKFMEAITGKGTTSGQKAVEKISGELKNLNLSETDIKDALLTEGMQDGEEEINSLIQWAQSIGFITDDSEESIQKLLDMLVETGVITGTASEAAKDLAASFEEVSTNSQSLTSELNGINNVLSAQSSGKSISFEDFPADSLKDYTSALEYNNGVLQLNADKVRELAKAKAEEQIASNDAQKTDLQMQYKKNAKQIEEYRQKLGSMQSVEIDGQTITQDTINSLLDQNEGLVMQCDQLDLLSIGLREATGEYQNWLNSQNASESGDMFDDALNAFQAIRDVNDAESSDFGRVGTKKYMAAVDFLVPDTINSADQAAVNSYLDSISYALSKGEDGSITGLNLEGFQQEAANRGLMEIQDGDYVLKGQMTMEEFAEGMNMGLPLVQAIFGELQEFNPEGAGYEWADEEIQTLGDLQVNANIALESLKELGQLSGLDLRIDVDDIEEPEEKIKVLDETIRDMQNLKYKPGIDTEDIEYANTVIQYCIAQKQLLEQPSIMTADASQCDEATQNVLSSLQQLQQAQNEYEFLLAIDADTSDAENQVSEALENVKSQASSEFFAKLGIVIDDTTTPESLLQQLQGLNPQILATLGIKTDTATPAIEETNNKSLTDKNSTLTATDLASPVINGVVYTLSLIPSSKETVITTRYNSVYSSVSDTIGVYGHGSAGASGTAHTSASYGAAFVRGNARLMGDWGLKEGQRVLIGELGREIVVDPLSGRWRTYGDNGAEFAYIPQNAIIFNHLQSESLLKQGFVNGRGTAMASGTALSNGGVNTSILHQKASAVSNSFTGNTTSGYSWSAEAAEEFSETLDWIETKLERLERSIDRISDAADSVYETFSTRNGALTEELQAITDKIKIQQQAYNSYMQAAASVGLSPDWAAKVQNGFIDIQTITDEDLNDRIQEYQKWYEKALDCKDAIDDLILSVQDLYQERFDLVEQEYDGILGQLQARSDLLDAYIDQTETRGWLLSAEYYTDMMETEQQILTHLQMERGALSDALNQAVAAGQIAEYSEAWYDMKDTINDVSQSIIESQTNLLDFANSIRELNWDRFDLLQDKISDIQEESEFLMELLEAGTLFDEQGNFNDAGKAKAGLLAVSYQTYKAQAEQYAQELAKLDQELQSDPYNQTLIDRRQKLLELQREFISAAESEKEAIRDLVEDGIKAQLDALEDLIERYTDMLDAEQDAYDYQKRVQKQQEEISALEKQLAAYTGDDSEEGRLKRQELQTSLKEARSDLADTQYDQRMDDTKKLLDELYTEYETILNQRLDSMEQLVTDVISGVTQEAGQIRDTISSEAAKAGYTLTQAMQTIWGDDGAVGTALGAIQASLEAMAAAAKKEADANIHEAEQSVTPAPQPAPAPVPQPAPQPEASSGDFFIYKKDTYWKDRLQRNTSIVDALKYHNFDSSFEARSMYYSKMGLSGIYTGSASQNLQMISWLRAHGYKNGVKSVPSTGLFWTNEGAPETILRKSDGALLTKLDAGDMVLNHAARDNFWNLMNHPDTFLGRLMPHALSGTTPSFSSTSDVNVSMSFVLPGVKNYDEFMTAVRTDPKFEKFIQEITLGRMNGHGKLTKNRLN